MFSHRQAIVFLVEAHICGNFKKKVDQKVGQHIHFLTTNSLCGTRLGDNCASSNRAHLSPSACLKAINVFESASVIVQGGNHVGL